MASHPPDLSLSHPFPEPPAPGRTLEVAPGILWARLPLPFRLNHVNVYFVDDGNGWAVMCCVAQAQGVSASNGSRPVSIS